MEDPEVMDALDRLILNQHEDLELFMSKITKYSDPSPVWAILHLYGKFIRFYTEDRVIGSVEIEAYQTSISKLAGDPLVQQLVAQVMGQMMDRGAGIDG